MSTENWGENFSVPRNRHEAVELDIWSLEAFFFSKQKILYHFCMQMRTILQIRKIDSTLKRQNSINNNLNIGFYFPLPTQRYLSYSCPISEDCFLFTKKFRIIPLSLAILSLICPFSFCNRSTIVNPVYNQIGSMYNPVYTLSTYQTCFYFGLHFI